MEEYIAEMVRVIPIARREATTITAVKRRGTRTASCRRIAIQVLVARTVHASVCTATVQAEEDNGGIAITERTKGCTLFVFLAELRGNVHGLPRTTADIPRTTAYLPRASAEIPRASTGRHGK